MKAKIFKPVKNTMQSGRGAASSWILEYERETPSRPEPVMGWTSAGDTLNQVRMKFPTQDAAIAFAEKHNMPYTLGVEHERKVVPRSYLDNFKYRTEEA